MKQQRRASEQVVQRMTVLLRAAEQRLGTSGRIAQSRLMRSETHLQVRRKRKQCQTYLRK